MTIIFYWTPLKSEYILAAKKKEKMNTLQLSKDLSVRQIAAIVKRLSREDKDKLKDLIWEHMFEYPDEYDPIEAERLYKLKLESGQLIPLEEAMKRWRSIS